MICTLIYGGRMTLKNRKNDRPAENQLSGGETGPAVGEHHVFPDLHQKGKRRALKCLKFVNIISSQTCLAPIVFHSPDISKLLPTRQRRPSIS